MANMHLVTGYAGQAHVTAADQASLYASLFGTDSFILNRGSKLAASIVTNNSISVADGDAIMQGRHIRLNEGETVNLTIENGETGMYRNDLIVLRYTKNVSTGIEEANLVVIKGTAVSSSPTDPEYTTGSIITDHVVQADMPLYRVPLNGLNVQALVQLCSVFGTIKEQVGAVEQKAKDAVTITGAPEGSIVTLNASGKMVASSRRVSSLGTGANYSLSGTTLTITTV